MTGGCTLLSRDLLTQLLHHRLAVVYIQLLKIEIISDVAAQILHHFFNIPNQSFLT